LTTDASRRKEAVADKPAHRRGVNPQDAAASSGVSSLLVVVGMRAKATELEGRWTALEERATVARYGRSTRSKRAIREPSPSRRVP